MKKQLLILFLILTFLPLASSADIQADYQIISNKVLVEINYENVQDFTYKLPNNYKALEVSTELYELENKGNILSIKKDSASFKFITDSYTENSLKNNFFILNNPFNQKADITIFLAESSILLDETRVISPKPNEITSDGRRVIIKWNNFDSPELVFNYEFTKQTSIITKIIIFILALIILTIILKYLFQKSKTKKTNLTKNLYEDEKKIINYLLEQEDNESWTKKMLKDLNITKVKLSRKLRSLEQKGLIKKIPYGNENKIILLK